MFLHLFWVGWGVQLSEHQDRLSCSKYVETSFLRVCRNGLFCLLANSPCAESAFSGKL